MAETRFRPTVYALDQRDVPASGVTPAQVFAAAGYVAQFPSVLTYFEDNLEVARLGGAGPALLTAADNNRAAVNTLTNFIRDCQEASAINPAAADLLNSLAGGAGVLIVQASSNAGAADSLAFRLGSPRVPPPPPPPTGQGNSNIGSNDDQNPPTSPPVTPGTPAPSTDGSALATTLPNLSDSGFVSVGTQGLRQRDVRVGEGATATSTSRVTVRYRGFLASDGTSFDNNVGTGSPLSATLGPTPTVIQGFAQGVTGMRVGGIREIFIPSALGYGSTGAGSSIPPNSDLVFAVQLVSVES